MSQVNGCLKVRKAAGVDGLLGTEPLYEVTFNFFLSANVIKTFLSVQPGLRN